MMIDCLLNARIGDEIVLSFRGDALNTVKVIGYSKWPAIHPWVAGSYPCAIVRHNQRWTIHPRDFIIHKIIKATR